MLNGEERIAILGASRGLGLSLVDNLLLHSNTQLLLSARKIQSIIEESRYQSRQHCIEIHPLDFTKPGSIESLCSRLHLFRPKRIIYCAGGGPYGTFADRPWHSHLWALQLNLIFPAQLLHSLINDKRGLLSDLQQVVFVGSAIAESSPDPGASSYSSSKHGLKGLLYSIVEENSSNGVDLRLYSPGYMDTTMLPPNSRPRLAGSLIADPQKIAEDLLQWALTDTNTTQWHRIFPSNK